MDIIWIIALLFLLSGIFSGSETAIFSLNTSQKEKFRRRRKINARAAWINLWLRTPEKTLSSILFANLAVNIAISETGNDFLSNIIGKDVQNFSVYSLLIITVFLLIFAEILPKIIALKTSEIWVQFFSPILRFWFWFSQLLVYPIYKLTMIIVSRFDQYQKDYDEQDLLESIHYADTMGVIEQEEKTILMRSVLFHHDTVHNAMVPRSSVFMLPHDITPAKAKKSFIEKGHQIALIYHEKDGHIIGFLHVRNLLAVLYRRLKSLRSQTQEILFFPESLSLKAAMGEFMRNKKEVAAVVDESGEFSGLITFKDILTRIVGGTDPDSEAELLTVESDITRVKDNIYQIDGDLDLNTFNDYFNLALEVKEAETLSGFLMEKLDGFPQSSTILNLNGLKFFNMKLNGYRIHSFYFEITEDARSSEKIEGSSPHD